MASPIHRRQKMGEQPSHQILRRLLRELDIFTRRHNRNPLPIIFFSLRLGYLDHACRQIWVTDEPVRRLRAKHMPLLDVIRQARRLYKCNVQPALVQPQKGLGMLQICVGVGKGRVQYLDQDSRLLPIQDRIYTRRGQDQNLRKLSIRVLVSDVTESGDQALGTVFYHTHAGVADVGTDNDEDGVGAVKAVCDQGDVVQGAFEDPNILVGSEFGGQPLEFGS